MYLTNKSPKKTRFKTRLKNRSHLYQIKDLRTVFLPPCEIYLNKKTFWIVIPERYSNCFMSRGLDELTPTVLMHVFQKNPYCVFDLFLIW